tara:strand:- start:547 stop:798 length:252 start_codon:yes stop_codon:yes gene_type:complete
MSKQLILITAPFNCSYCKKAEKELPALCESKGWELIKMEDESGDSGFPVDTYPTIMLRTNNKMVDTITGYPGKESVENTLKSY